MGRIHLRPRSPFTVIPTACSNAEEVCAHLLTSFSMGRVSRISIAHEVVGDTLWSVEELCLPGQQKRTVVMCYRVMKRFGQWGYRNTIERKFPYRVDCPLHLLELAPPANRRWREKVFAHHATARATGGTPAAA